MQNPTCKHQWEMVNIRPGYILTETCHKCQLVSSYFSFEDYPPFEEYKDGEHFWNVMDSVQSVSFDLRCKECNILVSFNELSSLMLCTGCRDDCRVNDLILEYSSQNIALYVAFGFKPVNEKKQLSPEQISVLEDYYNQIRKSSGTSIRIVSFDMIDDLDSCTGEYIMDRHLLSLTPIENK